MSTIQRVLFPIKDSHPPPVSPRAGNLKAQAITTIKILLIGGSIFGCLGLLNRMVTP